MTSILMVGAADTGRAPMAAALLRRLLAAQHGEWPVESAGVLGHDGAPAETEARDTMLHMGLDIGAHQARSIDDGLVAGAALVLAIDQGTALALRVRFPAAAARLHTLGQLSGRQRDVPDPFRMQIGAWMTYARELESLLAAALPRIVELIGSERAQPAPAEPALSGISSERTAAAGRIAQLLQVAIQMPGVVDWGAGRGRIESDLGAIAAAPAGPADLVAAYVGLLRAALTLLPSAPSIGQLHAISRAAEHLGLPIDQATLNELSAQLPALATLQ